MSVAARVSQEMGVKLGNEVSGIQVYSHQLLVRQFGTIHVCIYTYCTCASSPFLHPSSGAVSHNSQILFTLYLQAKSRTVGQENRYFHHTNQ